MAQSESHNKALYAKMIADVVLSPMFEKVGFRFMLRLITMDVFEKSSLEVCHFKNINF